MRRYCIFKRKNSKYYYVQFKDPQTGKYLPPKSTGQIEQTEALLIITDWIKHGIPQGRTKTKRTPQDLFAVNESLNLLKESESLSNDDVKRFIEFFKSRGFLKEATFQDNGPELVPWLLEFWDYEKSPYILEKLSHGQKITRNHAHNCQVLINKYWKPYFMDLLLSELTRDKINNFSVNLANLERIDQKGKQTGELLSSSTKNHILKAASVAFRWASNNDIIHNNPMRGLMMFTGGEKRKGILSDIEVQKIFKLDIWIGNPGNRLGNLLAMQTGLRLGEICALQICDIGKDRLFVRHSWNDTDGLKTTKNGEERQVPILPDLRDALLSHAKINPHSIGPGSFIFWDLNTTERPHAGKNISNALNVALQKIGIDKTERQARGVSFHSWRHYFAKKMADCLNERTAKLTGHKTVAMMEHYANHADEHDFKVAARATSEVFGRILCINKDKCK